MLFHNIKLALRNLWTQKLYTWVILLSLTIGFICANILISFLVFETSTDSFHAKKDRIFQVFSEDPFGGNGRIAYIPNFFHEYLSTNYPEVQDVCQITNLEGVRIHANQKELQDLMVLSVDSSFFTIFDFPLILGDKNSLAPGKIVLSRQKALTLFGTSDVLNEVVQFSSADTIQQLIVSGIVDKPFENSHLTFDALLYHSVLQDKWNGGASYVLLGDKGQAEPLFEKINSDPQRPGLIGRGKLDYFLDPLSNSYFNTDNRMPYMRTRSRMFITAGYLVCGIVLFIASFNFINLFLLFWHKRKKEIGIKKTLGISTKSLFGFSIVETGIYIFIAFMLSLLATTLLIPTFNSVFESTLSTSYFLNFRVVSFIGIILFLSGSMIVALSVLKQWSMKPVSLMSQVSSKAKFSKFLFVIQFVISITLTICSVVILKQMDHLKSAPLGFNRNIIQLNSPDRRFVEKLTVLKQKIAMLSDVNNVTVCSGNPISGNMIIRYDLNDDKFYTPYLFQGDDDFLKTLDLELIEGEMPSENRGGKLVNKTLARQFNMVDPVGQTVPGTKDIIIGVVKDFTCSSFKQKIPPVIISYKKDGPALLIDYKGKDLARLLPLLGSEWKEVFPDNIFTYRIIQEDLMAKYKGDTLFYRIIITFSIISMILSCFGLFALSWAVIQSRTKEMGIRKVLGATSLDILNLLTFTFTKRIVIAFALAIPIGFYMMQEWLHRFENKIELNVSIFVVTALIVVAITLLTLSIQTIKAALTNPVNEIRDE